MIPTPLIHQFEKDKKLQNLAIEGILSQARQNKVSFLNISKNEFSNLDFSTCEPLENIEVIDCSYNQTKLEKITISATVFPNLKHLYLFESKIKEIELMGSFPKLETLHLAKNSLSELDIDFDDFPVLETLYLYGNPLKNIQKELFDKELENAFSSIKMHFEFIKKDEVAYLHEAKLILIGNGEVGKTSIRIRLNDKKKPLPKKEERTKGLDIESYWIKNLPPSLTKKNEPLDFEFHIWDFGGQGKYREVQQLFCSRKSLYIYVTAYDDKPEKDDNYVGYPYWLSMANAFSFDENEKKPSPILCVVNKIDEDSRQVLNARTMQGEFNNIKDFIRISCEKLTNFTQLEDKIRQTLPLVSSDIFENKFSKKWVAIKDALDEEKSYHITYDRYLEICQENKLEDEAQVKLLIRTLDRMGYVIHYGEHPLLKEWVILNPLWVKDAIYKVLDDKHIQNAEYYPVEFDRVWKEYEAPKENFLQRIWSSIAPKKQTYTGAEHQHLINLMLAYEFCYQQQDNFGKKLYIIPAKLNEKPVLPTDYGEKFDVEIKLNYEPFLPAGTVNKLIVRLHRYLFSNYKWRNGAIFQVPLKSGLALIEEDWRAKSVLVRLKGKELEDIYQLIINELRSLNHDLKETKFLNKLEFETTVLFEKEYYKVPVFLRLEQDEKFMFLNEDEKINIRPNTFQMKKHQLTQSECNNLVTEYNHLVEKVGFMRAENVIVYDSNAKFNHKKNIEKIENRISEIKTILDNHEIVEYPTYPTQNTMQNPNDTPKNENSHNSINVTVNPVFHNTTTSSSSSSSSNQIDFKPFISAFEKVQEDLYPIKSEIGRKIKQEDNEELKEIESQVEEAIQEAEAIEIEAKKAEQGDKEAKEEVKKKKKYLKYVLSETTKAIAGLTKFALNPTNMENAKKSLNTGKEILEQIL